MCRSFHHRVETRPVHSLPLQTARPLDQGGELLRLLASLLSSQLVRGDGRGESQLQSQGVPDVNDRGKARRGVSAGEDPLHSRPRDAPPPSEELVTQTKLLAPPLKHPEVERDRCHDRSPPSHGSPVTGGLAAFLPSGLSSPTR